MVQRTSPHRQTAPWQVTKRLRTPLTVPRLSRFQINPNQDWWFHLEQLAWAVSKWISLHFLICSKNFGSAEYCWTDEKFMTLSGSVLLPFHNLIRDSSRSDHWKPESASVSTSYLVLVDASTTDWFIDPLISLETTTQDTKVQKNSEGKVKNTPLQIPDNQLRDPRTVVTSGTTATVFFVSDSDRQHRNDLAALQLWLISCLNVTDGIGALKYLTIKRWQQNILVAPTLKQFLLFCMSDFHHQSPLKTVQLAGLHHFANKNA